MKTFHARYAICGMVAVLLAGCASPPSRSPTAKPASAEKQPAPPTANLASSQSQRDPAVEPRSQYETEIGTLKAAIQPDGLTFRVTASGKLVGGGFIFVDAGCGSILEGNSFQIFNATHKASPLEVTLVQDKATRKWIATNGRYYADSQETRDLDGFIEGHVIHVIGGTNNPIRIKGRSFANTTVHIKNGAPVAAVESAPQSFSATRPQRISPVDIPRAAESADPTDVVGLLRQRKIEIQSQGSGIQNVSLKVRRLVPQEIEVKIPIGTFFVSNNRSAQNMVGTGERTVTLRSDDWVEISIPAACANRPRDIPGSGDSFQIERSPHQEELARLIPVLDRAGVPYAVRQAAVWIVTDDASYSDLGILVSRPTFQAFGGTRTINESESARALQICDEAGIDITRKRLWRDRESILRGLADDALKRWLEQK